MSSRKLFSRSHPLPAPPVRSPEERARLDRLMEQDERNERGAPLYDAYSADELRLSEEDERLHQL